MPPDGSPDVSRETSERLVAFEALVLSASREQNLIAASTMEAISSRHIADSLQLLDLLPATARTVVDIGSGAGFPGIVLAIAGRLHVTLVEPRALRARFLETAVASLGLSDTRIVASRAESLTGLFDVVTARAVAPLDRLFAITRHLAHSGTTWLLPKGRNVHVELVAARQAWQGDFEVRPSLTDAEAGIVIARNVRRREAA